MTTFSTLYKRYRFRHLLFGLSCTGNLFQAKIGEIFSYVRDFAQGIADDILVIGLEKDGSDHNAALKAVCACASEVKLCLNDKKCIFSCTIAPFVELVSRKDVKPHPGKLEASQMLQLQKAKCKLQSCLGIISYISKYTQEVVQVCKPLHELMSI